MIQRVFNCVASPPDSRNLLFHERLASAPPVVLPPSVDLRPLCSPIVDQGELGSCTANAWVSGLREFLLLKEGKPLDRLSRLFLYYQERLDEGAVQEDAGANLKDGGDCLINHGVCKEALDPYDISTFKNPPSAAAMAEAPDFKVRKYMQLTSLGAVKACLAQGYPVVMGMNVYDHMQSEQAAKLGSVACPRQGEQALGGHAVTIVGYKDTPKGPGYWKDGGYLIVRNSWGTSWGLQGYFKIAYAYVTLGYAFEFWTCR